MFSERGKSSPSMTTSVFAIVILLPNLSEALPNAQNSSGAYVLNILGLFPITTSRLGRRTACLQTSLFAIDEINQRSDILPDYTLNMTWADTRCDPGVATSGMFKLIFRPPVKVMILGGGCSPASQATAQVSHLWNLTQLAFGSSSPALSDRKRYPRFFRVSSSDIVQNDVRILLFQQFNWRKIATIHESFELFSDMTYDLLEKCRRVNISATTVEIFKGDPTLQVENLKRHDARIIVVGCYEDKARQIVCQAYKMGMMGPKIVWFFPGWYSTKWWQTIDPRIPCSLVEMDRAVEGHILTVPVRQNPMPRRGISGHMPDEWTSAFNEYYNRSAEESIRPFSSCYDAIWAIALALNKTNQHLIDTDHQKSLAEFTYSDGDIADVITGTMYNISFWGMQGHIKFGADGSSVRDLKIDHVSGGRRRTVGIYLPEDQDKFEWYDNGISWPNDRVPKDSIVIHLSKRRLSLQIYTSACGVAGVGCLISIIFFLVNTIYRKSRTVKMSSPVLNNLILLGCMFMLMSVVLEPLNDASALPMCMARQYFLAVGFSLVYGGLFSKTWRVYKIFFNKELRKLKIRDQQLFLCVVMLITINVCTLALWDITDRKYIVTLNSTREVSTEDEDVITQNQVDVCMSIWGGYFTAALYILNGIVLLIGAFLAWQTRKVHIEALNDSHQIGMCVYNTVILSGVAVTLSQAIGLQQDLLYGLNSALLLGGTILTEIIIFLPKVFHIRDERRTVFSTTDCGVQQLRVTDMAGGTDRSGDTRDGVMESQ